jgi:hypothetical protein
MFLHVHYPFFSFDTAKLSKITVFLFSTSTNDYATSKYTIKKTNRNEKYLNLNYYLNICN